MNVDRNIKRLLNTLGEVVHKSTLFKSIYYKITYPDGYELTVRLSNHFSERHKNLVLNVIQTSTGIYVIKDEITGISIALENEDIVRYLRSYLLIFPELNKGINDHREALRLMDSEKNKLHQSTLKLNQKLKEYESVFNDLDNILEEKNKLQLKIDELYKENNRLRDNNTKLLQKYNNYKQQVSSFKASTMSKLGKL